MSRRISLIDKVLRALSEQGHLIGMFRVEKGWMQVEVDQEWCDYQRVFDLYEGRAPEPKQ
jgi:hypothetical protein